MVSIRFARVSQCRFALLERKSSVEFSPLGVNKFGETKKFEKIKFRPVTH